jgi:hypothetical protein
MLYLIADLELVCQCAQGMETCRNTRMPCQDNLSSLAVASNAPRDRIRAFFLIQGILISLVGQRLFS